MWKYYEWFFGSSVIATKLILCDLPKALTNKIEVCA